MANPAFSTLPSRLPHLGHLGAVAAGWEAALVLRPGNALLDVGRQPQMTGVDLGDVADKLIARHANQDRLRERNRTATKEFGFGPFSLLSVSRYVSLAPIQEHRTKDVHPTGRKGSDRLQRSAVPSASFRSSVCMRG
jgi:hypothetical protein